MYCTVQPIWSNVLTVFYKVLWKLHHMCNYGKQAVTIVTIIGWQKLGASAQNYVGLGLCGDMNEQNVCRILDGLSYYSVRLSKTL